MDVSKTLVRRSPGTPGITCPYCGSDDEDAAFTAPEDIKAAKEYVKWAALEDVADHFQEQVKSFSRLGTGIGLTVSVERPRNPKPYPWREDLLRGLTCDLCGAGYGVYAIALFCPDCGGRNVHVHFAREVELINRQVDLSAAASKENDDELAYRLLGNAHEDVVTALETYLRTLFLFLARRRLSSGGYEDASQHARRGNPFQNIERAKALYATLGCDPFRVLSSPDQDFLLLHIEKRHIIGHNLGLVDERYLRTASRGVEGEGVRLLGDDVRRFARLAFEIVVSGLEVSEPEFLPSGPLEGPPGSMAG